MLPQRLQPGVNIQKTAVAEQKIASKEPVFENLLDIVFFCLHLVSEARL